MELWIWIIIGILFLVLCFALWSAFKPKVEPMTTENYITITASNGKSYPVINTADMSDNRAAAEFLADIDQRIGILKDYLWQNQDSYPAYKPYIRQFYEKINGVQLLENNPGGKYTSYTVNKGSQIYLCLRSINGQLIADKNLVMYVVLHELAHVACPEFNHTQLFKDIFKFFIEVASRLGIYRETDYSINPKDYCGIVISEKLV
jgi:hypothetical protein